MGTALILRTLSWRLRRFSSRARRNSTVTVSAPCRRPLSACTPPRLQVTSTILAVLRFSWRGSWSSPSFSVQRFHRDRLDRVMLAGIEATLMAGQANDCCFLAGLGDGEGVTVAALKTVGNVAVSGTGAGVVGGHSFRGRGPGRLGSQARGMAGVAVSAGESGFLANTLQLAGAPQRAGKSVSKGVGSVGNNGRLTRKTRTQPGKGNWQDHPTKREGMLDNDCCSAETDSARLMHGLLDRLY